MIETILIAGGIGLLVFSLYKISDYMDELRKEAYKNCKCCNNSSVVF